MHDGRVDDGGDVIEAVVVVVVVEVVVLLIICVAVLLRINAVTVMVGVGLDIGPSGSDNVCVEVSVFFTF